MPPYTGHAQDRRYTGENADITYNLKRCIHAEQCIKRLPGVFDKDKRPWIQPADESGDVLLNLVEHCPSGALHVIRKDGGAEEVTPAINRVTLWPNGPLEISGDLTLTGAAVDIAGETRVTLCRCGDSKNKPFCDNSHKDLGFTALNPIAPAVAPVLEVEGGALHITVQPDGCLNISGNLRLISETGIEVFAGESARLCRCGGSNNKPFCDGSHFKTGFQAE